MSTKIRKMITKVKKAKALLNKVDDALLYNPDGEPCHDKIVSVLDELDDLINALKWDEKYS